MTHKLLLPLLLTSPLCAQNAYCVDTNLDILYSLDLQTGAVVQIGSTLNNGLGTPADLCWRDDTNEIWTIDLGGGAAGTIDPLTATFTPVWNTTVSGWQGMAWDHTTKQFFCHNQNNTLYRLDPVTGVLTLVGSIVGGGFLITALEIDATGRLWGLNFSTGSIVEINKNTGAQSTPILTPGVNNLQGMAIDAEGVWYAISTGTDSLYRLDPVTGASTLVGANAGTQFVKGMVITGSAVQRAGIACPDGLGTLRRMTWSGGSNLGNILSVGCDVGAIPTLTFVTYGLSPYSVGPFTLPLDMGAFGAPGCRLYQSVDAILGPVLTGTQLPFPIPASPAFVSVTVLAQCPILDTTATPNPAGMVFSDVIKFTITP